MSSTAELTTPTIAPGERWTLDRTHSSIGFSVVYMGVVPFEASFREVDASLDAAGLRGTASVSSVGLDDENLAAHLGSPDFFDVDRHPTISFESGPLTVEGDAVSVEGTLEIKSTRVPVRFSGAITQPVSDPWGNRKLGLTLAGTVDRTDFGLRWNAPLPEGGQMLADEVDLTARLVFVAAGEEV
jgi:polyisoprenoid-binding protein YceI